MKYNGKQKESTINIYTNFASAAGQITNNWASFMFAYLLCYDIVTFR